MTTSVQTSYLEKRRHQRVRFSEPLPMQLARHGERAQGELENLSLGGLMLRCPLPLAVGDTIGCEFRVFDSPLIDIVASVVSRVGDGLYGARFQAGPMSQHLVDAAINDAIGNGAATVLTIHEGEMGKIMRIAGGLTAATRSDFLHGLERVGVIEIDLSAVTYIDADGAALCRQAVERHGADITKRSRCVEAALRKR